MPIDQDVLDAATTLTQEQLRRAGAIVADFSDHLDPHQHSMLVGAALVALSANFQAMTSGLVSVEDPWTGGAYNRAHELFPRPLYSVPAIP